MKLLVGVAASVAALSGYAAVPVSAGANAAAPKPPAFEMPLRQIVPIACVGTKGGKYKDFNDCMAKAPVASAAKSSYCSKICK